MISLQKKFLFIHIPKTGGNSIQNNLKNYSEDKFVSVIKQQDGVERFEIKNDKYKIHKHSTLNNYKKEIEPDIYNNLFKFATLRNPWDMLISFYFSPFRGKIDWNRNDFKEFIYRIPNARRYITEENIISKVDQKLGLQLYPKISSLNKDIDFILRFENLNEDFKKICEIIDIPFKNLPKKNKSSRMHYTKYYDEELIKIVKNKYKEEINYGHYNFGQ